MRNSISTMFAALPFLLAGCAASTASNEPATTAPPAMAQGCNADAAQGMIGSEASVQSGGEIIRITGASQLRWGPPGAVFTMEYRTDRVNVIYDADMVITAIRCG